MHLNMNPNEPLRENTRTRHKECEKRVIGTRCGDRGSISRALRMPIVCVISPWIFDCWENDGSAAMKKNATEREAKEKDERQ